MRALLPGEIIQKLRKRKGWSRDHLVSEVATNNGYMLNLSLHRLENDEHRPGQEALNAILDALGFDMEAFFLPFLENGTGDLYAIREQLDYLLSDFADEQSIKQAKRLLAKLEKHKKFKKGCNLQLKLSLKVKLYLHLNKASKEIMPLIREAMDITYSDFDENDFDPTCLFLEEPELLHSMAKVLFNDGKHEKAINLAETILFGLVISPFDEHSKERQKCPIMLTLSEFLIEVGNYSRAFEVCIEGYHTTWNGELGGHAPDFLFKQAICLYYLEQKSSSLEPIMNSYFCFVLQKRIKKAAHVLSTAHEFGLNFETYETEKINPLKSLPQISYGQSIECNSIGEFIHKLRKDAGLTLEELCLGICSKSTLHSIERGESIGSIYHIEAIMQRLGRHMSLYFTLFPSKRELDEKQKRDRVAMLLTLGKLEEAEEILDKLKGRYDYKKNINLQFILMARATILITREKNYSKQYLSMLNEALAVTIPEFQPEKIPTYHLCYNEIVIINQIALHHVSQPDSESHNKGMKMFKDLIYNMNVHIVDDSEKMRMYPIILYNYSNFLGIAGEYEDALDLIDEGELAGITSRRLNILSGFAINRACDLLELNRKNWLAYFALAYYGNAAMEEYGGAENMRIVKARVKQLLGIEFM